jgi:SHAQKYF class myb-like DNA-binding protein
MENLKMKIKNPQEDLILYINQNNLDDNLSENLSEQNDLQIGRWKQEEHFRFIKGCLLFGNNWKKVKKYVKTRSSAQIRSHAQKYLIKLNKKYHHICFDNTENSSENYNLDYEFIQNVTNSDLKNFDMEKIEQMILIIFKNSNSNLNIFNERHNNTINLNENILKNETSINSKKKEKIFNFIKISKCKDSEYENLNYNNNTKNFLNKKINNNIDFSILYNKSNGLNDLGIEQIKMIQIEKFIHNCLDSFDPNDLIKLFYSFDENSFFQNNYSINQYFPYYYIPKNDNELTNSFNQSKENFINFNNNISDFTSTQNSNQGENQKQIFDYMNFQHSKINELNKNFQNLYSNSLKDFYNNYININSYPNSIQLNPFLINQFQNFNH